MPDIEINSEILKHVAQRNITRLVHFTRVESLRQIIRNGEIASTQRLRSRNPEVVTNDSKRLDGHPDYICCSVQYPNVKLLHDYRQKEPAQEWVILFLHTIWLGFSTTRFSPVNAATDCGGRIQDGTDAFRSLFWPRVGMRKRRRSKLLQQCCPTDIQAEVLVKGAIPIPFVIGIAVESDAAKRETEPVLNDWPGTRPPLTVEPLLFNEDDLLAVVGYRGKA